MSEKRERGRRKKRNKLRLARFQRIRLVLLPCLRLKNSWNVRRVRTILLQRSTDVVSNKFLILHSYFSPLLMCVMILNVYYVIYIYVYIYTYIYTFICLCVFECIIDVSEVKYFIIKFITFLLVKLEKKYFPFILSLLRNSRVIHSVLQSGHFVFFFVTVSLNSVSYQSILSLDQ